MTTLFGRSYTREELARYLGDMSQVAGVRPCELSDGPARGTRAVECYTGSGFRFMVLPDRGMDIGPASYNGWPLAWTPPVGIAHPAYFNPEGLNWLRTFGGGLMAGCGLGWFGAPGVDQGEALGLHGRLSHLPARNVAYGAAWEDDEYVIWVQGEMRETALFHDHLVLNRRISTTLGASSLRIEDTVTNTGFTSAPHMIVYHCNFGHPVVSPDTELLIDDERVEARDEAAAVGLDSHRSFDEPTPGYAEQVFFHQPRPDETGMAQSTLVNRALGIGAYVRFRTDTLPYMLQWKMMGMGEYVCGMEPVNTFAGSRIHARETGRLRHLEPGESVSYLVEIGALGEDDLPAA